MDPGILRRRLYEWRAERAQRDGVAELFRILPTSTIDAIAMASPTSMDELIQVKGIKDAKAGKYGDEILAVVRGISPSALAPMSVQSTGPTDERTDDDAPMTYSVSVYLDILNRAVSAYEARIVGETLEVKTQGAYTYLSLLDPINRSVLRVMVPRMVLEFAGIELLDGMEIAVTGRADIYKPRGSLSFRADAVELVGEGALKKQYDLLKKKLSLEGLFDESRKREIPEYPVRVGLLTSKTGAVIHDFQSNLGAFGYKLRFKDIRVEGAQAIPDILAGLERMKKESLDVLVLIRGGGSMESLQAFNHEQVVRAIASYPVPVICAIGHDKDVPLAQLAADVAPSTPTACTEILNRSWREAIHAVSAWRTDILGLYQDELRSESDRVRRYGDTLQSALSRIVSRFTESSAMISSALIMIGRALTRGRESLEGVAQRFVSGYAESLRRIDRAITEENKVLLINNPTRQLKLGFSILSRKGAIIRSAKDLPTGTDFEATLADGTLMATSKGKRPKTT
jgi:exodeoxyribonuclease VII large subunit